MSIPDPSYVAAQLKGILSELEDVDQLPLDEQYRQLDAAQRQLADILAGPTEPGPKPGLR